MELMTLKTQQNDMLPFETLEVVFLQRVGAAACCGTPCPASDKAGA